MKRVFALALGAAAAFGAVCALRKYMRDKEVDEVDILDLNLTDDMDDMPENGTQTEESTEADEVEPEEPTEYGGCKGDSVVMDENKFIKDDEAVFAKDNNNAVYTDGEDMADAGFNKKDIDEINADFKNLIKDIKKLAGSTGTAVKNSVNTEKAAEAKEKLLEAADRMNKLIDEYTPKVEGAIKEAFDDASSAVDKAVESGEAWVGEHPELAGKVSSSIETLKKHVKTAVEKVEKAIETTEETEQTPDISGITPEDGKDIKTDLTEDDEANGDGWDINETDMPTIDGDNIQTDLTDNTDEKENQ